MIAQVDEKQVAVVALAMHPARQAYCFASVRWAKLAAIVRAEWVHGSA